MRFVTSLFLSLLFVFPLHSQERENKLMLMQPSDNTMNRSSPLPVQSLCELLMNLFISRLMLKKKQEHPEILPTKKNDSNQYQTY